MSHVFHPPTKAWWLLGLCEHRYALSLAVIFCVAFGLRLGLAATLQGLDAEPSASAQPDQLEYEGLAFRVSTGRGYSMASGAPTIHRPPGTTLSLLPIYALAGRSWALGRVWFCLLSALTCVAVGWLGRMCFGPMVGVLAALWLAFYPGHFYYPMHFLSEVPYGLCLTLGCACTLRALQAQRPLGRWTVLAGANWALAILTRPQIIFLAPIAAAAILLLLHRHRRGSAAMLAVQLTLALALLTPWVVRNSIVAGRATLATVGAYTFWGAHNDRVLADPALRGSWIRTSDLVDVAHPFVGSEPEREAAAWRYGFDFVRNNLPSMPALEAMKVVRLLSPFEDSPNRIAYWGFAAGWIGTAPFVVVGLIAAFRQNRSAALVVTAPILATLCCALLFYGSARFRDSAAPLLVVFAAVGLVSLIQRGYAAWQS